MSTAESPSGESDGGGSRDDLVEAGDKPARRA